MLGRLALRLLTIILASTAVFASGLMLGYFYY
jgi:hypothetical protein